jgi:hypothetical protein
MGKAHEKATGWYRLPEAESQGGKGGEFCLIGSDRANESALIRANPPALVNISQKWRKP